LFLFAPPRYILHKIFAMLRRLKNKNEIVDQTDVYNGTPIV
jgi:hypothetical protein